MADSTNMGLRKRVLFVDDEPAILSGLQNLLYKDRKRWDMVFAPGADQAMEELAKQAFDVVVSDMRMPGMDGAWLLNQIKARYPATARIMLSGHADREAIVRALPALHQLLAKPCDVLTLRSAIERGLHLSADTRSATLNALIGRIEKLPSPAVIHAELANALEAKHTRLEDIAAIVMRDPALAAKVLQLVCSAYFGSGPTSSIRQAVALLGLDRLRYIASSTRMFTAEPAWQHLAASTRAQTVAELAAKLVPTHAEAAFSGGLLHDVGRLVHVVAGEDLQDLDAGACLLDVWGLPASLVEVVRHHRAPDRAPEAHRLVACAVHVASGAVDHAAVERAGCIHLLEGWLAMAGA
jgi:HD-like signal output (HDOD) protein/CheY-like chemotaxis protein